MYSFNSSYQSADEDVLNLQNICAQKNWLRAAEFCYELFLHNKINNPDDLILCKGLLKQSLDNLEEWGAGLKLATTILFKCKIIQKDKNLYWPIYGCMALYHYELEHFDTSIMICNSIIKQYNQFTPDNIPNDFWNLFNARMLRIKNLHTLKEFTRADYDYDVVFECLFTKPTLLKIETTNKLAYFVDLLYAPFFKLNIFLDKAIKAESILMEGVHADNIKILELKLAIIHVAYNIPENKKLAIDMFKLIQPELQHIFHQNQLPSEILTTIFKLKRELYASEKLLDSLSLPFFNNKMDTTPVCGAPDMKLIFLSQTQSKSFTN